MKTLVEACAEHCPGAILNIIRWGAGGGTRWAPLLLDGGEASPPGAWLQACLPGHAGVHVSELHPCRADSLQPCFTKLGPPTPPTCPLARSNPVNSTVPIAAEVLKKRGVYDARKVRLVTELGRASRDV